MASYGYLLPTRDVVMTSEGTADLTARTRSDVIELAADAETLGLDAVWIGDSVTAKPRLEPLTTLSGIATVTDELDLGTAVYLPPLRHVVNVAHATATLDQLSGGRLHLGVGIGRGDAVRREYENLDVPFGRRGTVLNEGLDVLEDLWSGEPVTHDGPFYSLEEASIGFQPARKPPIYVASSVFDPEKGFPRAIRRRIELAGDGWLPTGITPEEYAVGIDLFRDAAAEFGRDPDDVRAACYVDVVVEDSRSAAIEEAREYLIEYYPKWTDLPDEKITRRGAFGPPEHVRSQLERYEEAGVDQFVVRFPSTEQRRNLEAFASLLE